MDTIHLYAGYAIPALFLAMALWGLTLKLLRREEEPAAFRALLHWTENVLIAQIVVGIVLLIMGRRILVPGQSLAWLHYLYGSLFPLIAIVGGRLAGLRRERQEFVGIAWGAFFAFGLTARALMLGLEHVG
ncbi:MAG TPA: hypothetical protein VGA69_07225 [Nitriliruptorales bacterium]